MLYEHDVVAAVRRVELRELRLWVEMGWVKPAGSDHGPVFDDLDVARIRLVCDLRKDMARRSCGAVTVGSDPRAAPRIARIGRGCGHAAGRDPSSDCRRL